ncbi:hypothetical protein U1Q18_051208, partial [Sarracenia purpurea var. burkii]
IEQGLEMPRRRVVAPEMVTLSPAWRRAGAGGSIWKRERDPRGKGGESRERREGEIGGDGAGVCGVFLPL